MPNRTIRPRVIIFTRYPLPGSTKKRLIPALGSVAAAQLQKKMTLATIHMVRSASRIFGYDLVVYYTGGDKKKMRQWLGADLKLKQQCQGDLGARMLSAFQDAHESGGERALIIGSDSPDITGDYLRQAFHDLNKNDLVFGPSFDGGYWLIGMRRPVDIFSNVEWGRKTVLDHSLALAQKRRLSYQLLDRISDIDRPEDLDQLPEQLTQRPLISVIIPALNEAHCIAFAIESARDNAVEIIVVDGGSRDATVKRAQEIGVRVVTCPPGRAGQMNRGAELASGEILLFLHADTKLPPNYPSLIYQELLNTKVAAGAFQFKTDIDSKAMSLIEWLVNFRSRYLQMPYGDQAIFIRASIFRLLGGFPRVPIAEDLYFLRLVKQKGPIKIIRAPARTSGRRHKMLGCFRTTLINQMIVLGIFWRVPPDRLALLYRKGKRISNSWT